MSLLNAMRLLASLAGITCITAIPAAAPLTERTDDSYPEVIPGPGMPSLASLNLTSAELYRMPLPAPLADIAARARARAGPFTKRQSHQCSPHPNAYAIMSHAQACVNYLFALDTYECHAPDGTIATSGNAKINTWADPLGPLRHTTSHCRDVAQGLTYVLYDCLRVTNGEWTVAGYNAAWGNGAFLAGVMDSGWNGYFGPCDSPECITPHNTDK